MHRDKKRQLATSRAAWIAGCEGREISAKLVSALMEEVLGQCGRKERRWRKQRQRRIRPKMDDGTRVSQWLNRERKEVTSQGNVHRNVTF